MIKEFNFFHGVVFSKIICETEKEISVKFYPTDSNASYILNDKIGLYVKYSKKRMSPWRFSFSKKHQDEILEMKNKLKEVYTIFVCNNDGVVCLNFLELKNILNEIHEDVEWVSISRGPREKYLVKGSDGKMNHKIGYNEFPKKIFTKIINKNGIKFEWR